MYMLTNTTCMARVIVYSGTSKRKGAKQGVQGAFAEVAEASVPELG
jgi:hypothetical protein